MKRLVLVLVLAVASTLGAGSSSVLAAGSGAANAHALPQSEIFATNNTATITDPNDPRLHTRLVRFEHQVDDIIRDGGAQPRRSTLLDGVFWSSDQQAGAARAPRGLSAGRAGAARRTATRET